MNTQKDIEYIKGDVFKAKSETNIIIPHCCNDVGKWGKGFVVSISNIWPEPAAEFKKWSKGRSVKSYVSGDYGLGQIQIVKVAPTIYICNMVSLRNIYPYNAKPLRMESLKECMIKLYEYIDNDFGTYELHCPKFGSDLAKGKWSKIESCIENIWLQKGLDVYVYEFAR